jgi:AraC-like DNA-binding protein
MTPAGSADEFLQAAAGRYIAGPNWISYCHDERLSGVVLWGHLDEGDARALLRTTPLAGPSPLAVGRARLVDARLLDVPTPQVFMALHEHFATHREVSAQAVTRLALLRPEGLVGALAVGFARVLDTPFPMETFTDPADALAWLELTEYAFVLEEVERLQSAQAGGAAVVRDLRTALEQGSLASATLAAVARKMGLSARSLQRRLREAGTSFQRELAGARVRVAQRRFAESAASISEVAYEVGYSTVHQFSAVFRKATGLSPRQWKSERRRG